MGSVDAEFAGEFARPVGFARFRGGGEISRVEVGRALDEGENEGRVGGGIAGVRRSEWNAWGVWRV